MGFAVVDIDHLMIRVADLDRAAEQFARLGFTVTDVREPKGAPIDNRLVLFRPYPGRSDVANFLELMCVLDRRRTPPEVAQTMSFLGDSEGIKSIVCNAPDVDASREAMRRVGLETSKPLWIDRHWTDDRRGVSVTTRARPAVPVLGQLPFQLNPYETDTLDGYGYRPWTEHPNGARYLAGVTGVTEDIAEDARYMAETVFGVEPEWISPDIVLVRPRDLFLRIVTPSGFMQTFPGAEPSAEQVLPHLTAMTIHVGDLDAVRQTLQANGVHTIDTPNAVLVPRRYAANTLVEFRDKN